MTYRQVCTLFVSKWSGKLESDVEPLIDSMLAGLPSGVARNIERSKDEESSLLVDLELQQRSAEHLDEEPIKSSHRQRLTCLPAVAS